MINGKQSHSQRGRGPPGPLRGAEPFPEEISREITGNPEITVEPAEKTISLRSQRPQIMEIIICTYNRLQELGNGSPWFT
jgi:hypothetical protein